jgi:ABC-type transport system involved in multi-copper enzyme maturation permease subunit
MLVTWATPIWLLSLGAALGVVVLGAALGILYLVSRRAGEWVFATVRESILLPIFYVAAALAVFAVAAMPLVPGLPYRELIASVSRISAVGPRDVEVVVPASTRDFPLKGVDVRLSELVSFSASANEPVSVSTNILHNFGQTLAFRLTPGNEFTWVKPFSQDKSRAPVESDDLWSATNVSAKPATLRVHTLTDIEFPQVRVVPYTAAALVLLVLAYLALRLATPKVSAIALTTAKESMSQPLYYVVLAIGCFALLAFIFVPYNTFGEDVKMLKDSGLTLIMVLAMIVAVWSASVSVWEEVEGRTALTVLSKPVTRRQFVLGKFLGILGPVVVLFVVLGVLFLITISYKVVYDSREVAKSEPPWQLCYLEMIRTVPGLVLAFLETVVMAAISVAISTRLPMIANLIVCASIYVLGHIVPMLVNSSVGKFEIVRFVGQFIATVLPVLDHFNIQAAVAAGAAVPLSYLGMALVYCVLYSSIAMLLGLAMFEDRDLA